MAEVEDTKLKEILERFVKGKKDSEEIRKEVCLHICFRMLTEEGNFESEDSAHNAFSLHYHGILIQYFQKIIYPDETGPISRNQRGYLLRKIKKNIWATIWMIHTSPQVLSFLHILILFHIDTHYLTRFPEFPQCCGDNAAVNHKFNQERGSGS